MGPGGAREGLERPSPGSIMTAMALRARETSDDERLEHEVQALAREIATAGASERAAPLPPRPLERAGARLGDVASALQDAALPLRRRLPRLPRRRGRAAPSRRVLRRRRDPARARPRARRGRAAAVRRAGLRRRRAPERHAHGAPAHRGRDARGDALPQPRAPLARRARRRPSTSSARRRSPSAEADALRGARRRDARGARRGDARVAADAAPRARSVGRPSRASTCRSSRPRSRRASARSRRPTGSRRRASGSVRSSVARARPAPRSTSTWSTTT